MRGVMDMFFSAENSTSFASRFKAISLTGFVLEFGLFMNPTIVSLFFFPSRQPCSWQDGSPCAKKVSNGEFFHASQFDAGPLLKQALTSIQKTMLSNSDTPGSHRLRDATKM